MSFTTGAAYQLEDPKYRCCCGIHIRTAATFIGAFGVLVELITFFLIFFSDGEWIYKIGQQLGTLLGLFICFLIIYADRKERAWAYMPFLIVAGLGLIFDAILGLVALYTCIFMPQFIVGKFPDKEEATFHAYWLGHVATYDFRGFLEIHNFCTQLIILIVIFEIFGIWFWTIIYRAYRYMKDVVMGVHLNSCLRIIAKNLYDTTPGKEAFSVPFHMDGRSCRACAKMPLYTISPCKRYIYALAFGKFSSCNTGKRYSSSGEQHFYFFRFNLQEGSYSVHNVIGDSDYLCDCRKSTLRCTENGKIYVWNRELMFEPDRQNGLIYHGELIFDEHYEKFYALKLIRKDIGDELNFDRAVVVSVDYPNKWILLGNEAKMAILEEGKQTRMIYPTDDTYESSFYYRFSENAKQMGRFTSHLFYDHNQLYLLHSSFCVYGWQCLYKHILYEVDIDESNSTYKCNLFGALENFHAARHTRILYANGVLLSVSKGVLSMGFVRVPSLKELAFWTLQKKVSQMKRGGCRGKIEGYTGNLTEEKIKNILGLKTVKKLVPILG